MLTSNCTFHPHSACQCIIGGEPRTVWVDDISNPNLWAPTVTVHKYEPIPNCTVTVSSLNKKSVEDRLADIEKKIDELTSLIVKALQAPSTEVISTATSRLYNWFIKKKKVNVSLVEIYKDGPVEFRLAVKARKIIKLLIEQGLVSELVGGVFYEGVLRSEAFTVNPVKHEVQM